MLERFVFGEMLTGLDSWIQESRALWCLHLGSVLFMTGLIWLIQLVQYPVMSEVGRDAFRGFHAFHSSRITWIVLPTMLAQLATAGLLLTSANPESGAFRVTLLCAGLTVIVFASTAFLSVPAHQVLAQGFDAEAHRRLVQTNWVRTLAWSFHSLLVLYVTFKSLAKGA